MALTSHVTKQEPIPHEPGHSMTFRQLSWQDLKAAREAQQAEVFANMRGMGKEILGHFREIEERKAEVEAEQRKVAADPLAAYDLGTVLRAGIVAWTYDEPVTPEAIGRLDEETAKWAGLQIVALKQRSEDDQKNGF